MLDDDDPQATMLGDDDLHARVLGLAAGRKCWVCNRAFVSVKLTETRGDLQELY